MTTGVAAPLPEAGVRPGSRGPLFGVHLEQLVATQVAAVLVVVGAIDSIFARTAGVTIATAILTVTWLRLRGRWTFEWLGIALRYSGRRRVVSLDPDHGAVLGFVAPGLQVTPANQADDPAAVLSDGFGLTTILELGDPAALFAGEATPLPALGGLRPASSPDQPTARMQLLLTVSPAPASSAGMSPAANSYRHLSESSTLGHGRAMLAVRVLRAEGWSDEELRRSLAGLVRKLVRQLSAAPARPLGEAAARRAITDLAHVGTDGPARENWAGLDLGGLVQATFRCQATQGNALSGTLISRLLTLPAAATTVAFSAGVRPVESAETTVRLAAADPNTLAVASGALRKLLATHGARVRRLDGEHLSGLAATLPLGGSTASAATRALLPARLDLPVNSAGLMLGRNRHGAPLLVRLFRPEATRVLLVGGVRCAQLMVLRAMALGAQVVVQTSRPDAWEPFVRGSGVPGESATVVPPGRSIDTPPGSALRPLLTVIDLGPVAADRRPGAAWQATLIVRDDFGSGDIDTATRSDLVVLQPLHPAEATLLGGALSLGETAQWLTRIRPDMVGVVNRRAVRWATLAPTTIEHSLVGIPTR